jgi:hypothetical protein
VLASGEGTNIILGDGMKKVMVVDLNTGDPSEDYSRGYDWHEDVVRSWHSFAVASGGYYAPGGFYNGPKDAALVIFVCQTTVDFESAAWLIDTTKKENSGVACAIGFKDDRQRFLERATNKQFTDAVAKAGSISSFFFSCDESLVAFYSLFVRCPIRYCPILLPVRIIQGSSVMCSVKNRKGIMVGTTRDRPINRQHDVSIMVAKRLGEEYGEEVTIIKDDLSYYDWMKLVGRHKIVINMDIMKTPGQVAGDCLALAVPCLGGNNWLALLHEQITVPRGFSVSGEISVEDVLKRGAQLLKNPHAYQSCYEKLISYSYLCDFESLSYNIPELK